MRHGETMDLAVSSVVCFVGLISRANALAIVSAVVLGIDKYTHVYTPVYLSRRYHHVATLCRSTPISMGSYTRDHPILLPYQNQQLNSNPSLWNEPINVQKPLTSPNTKTHQKTPTKPCFFGQQDTTNPLTTSPKRSGPQCRDDKALSGDLWLAALQPGAQQRSWVVSIEVFRCF